MTYNKIILLLMIKNESKIIERCLMRALDHVDAISILDTGSDDNTVEVCNNFLSTCGKPFKISVEPFRNFGFNRTISFEKVQELCKELNWDPDTTYGMAVDADMIIKPSPEFKDYKMTLPGYTVIQQNGSLKYYNSRFLQCSYMWKCLGATHEYWSGDPVGKIPYEIFYIEDVNDGGCKSDKYERDVRLLTDDLKTDPDNGRTHFYLAQSYKDSGKFKDAIKHYKIRIKIGGWYEEVWYAHYQIGRCYEFLKNYEKYEAWMNKAFQFHPRRSEPLYHLCVFFKNKREHYKSYHYYLKGHNISFPKDDVLFIEHIIYDGLFEYENTILACYLCDKSKQVGLADLITYINTKSFYLDNVWDNLYYYIEPLCSSTYNGEYNKLFLPVFNEYKASSCSIIPYGNQYIMNARYVNYTIENNGSYTMPNGIVKTKNYITFLNSNYYPVENLALMKENVATYPSNIEGLEDVRLFYYNDKVHFTASSKNVTNDGNIVIAMGEYDIKNHSMNNISVIEPPRPSNCEKNWIFTNNGFIYGWHPLEVGNIKNSKLEIHTTFQTPPIFSRFRGSSGICEHDNKLWCVAHFVRYSSPRVYYHTLVQFRKDMKPEMYSLPFVFKKHAIEYCLGLHIKDGVCCFIFSQNDSDPAFITIPITNLKFCLL